MTLPAATRALVSKLIDHIDPTLSESKRAAVLHKLEWHKHTSTEEHLIEQRWKGYASVTDPWLPLTQSFASFSRLVEKFQVNNYEIAADNLSQLKARFLDPARLISSDAASSRREANVNFTTTLRDTVSCTQTRLRC